MTERDETFKLDYYINLIIKHRWLVIIPFCLAMIVGIYLSLTLPRIYQAYTSILVRPQSSQPRQASTTATYGRSRKMAPEWNA